MPSQEVLAICHGSINDAVRSCARSRVHIGPCHHYHYSNFNTKIDRCALYPLRLQFEFRFPQLGLYLYLYSDFLLCFVVPPPFQLFKNRFSKLIAMKAVTTICSVTNVDLPEDDPF